MFCAILRPINSKGPERFPGVLPSREWLRVGQMVVYLTQGGDERVGIVAAPDFDADEDAVTREWGTPHRIVAVLSRTEIDWPEEDVMEVTLPEIES